MQNNINAIIEIAVLGLFYLLINTFLYDSIMECAFALFNVLQDWGLVVITISFLYKVLEMLADNVLLTFASPEIKERTKRYGNLSMFFLIIMITGGMPNPCSKFFGIDSLAVKGNLLVSITYSFLLSFNQLLTKQEWSASSALAFLFNTCLYSLLSYFVFSTSNLLSRATFEIFDICAKFLKVTLRKQKDDSVDEVFITV